MSWAGAVSAVFVLDSKGKQLIGRDFRGDTPAGCVERFVNIVTGETGPAVAAAGCVPSHAPCLAPTAGSDVDTEADIKPVIHDEGITYSYVTYNSLYLLAVSRTNVNAVAVLYFLHRLVDVFKFYFEARPHSPDNGRQRPGDGARLGPRVGANTGCLPPTAVQELDEESLRDNFVIGAWRTPLQSTRAVTDGCPRVPRQCMSSLTR